MILVGCTIERRATPGIGHRTVRYIFGERTLGLRIYRVFGSALEFLQRLGREAAIENDEATKEARALLDDFGKFGDLEPGRSVVARFQARQCDVILLPLTCEIAMPNVVNDKIAAGPAVDLLADLFEKFADQNQLLGGQVLEVEEITDSLIGKCKTLVRVLEIGAKILFGTQERRIGTVRFLVKREARCAQQDCRRKSLLAHVAIRGAQPLCCACNVPRTILSTSSAVTFSAVTAPSAPMVTVARRFRSQSAMPFASSRAGPLANSTMAGAARTATRMVPASWVSAFS